jgi:formylglycine-generating enzyme required for sulfatase activity
MVVSWLSLPLASAQITIPTVRIGYPGNAPDPATGSVYGSVAYEYNIATTEVTNAQYTAFLNAVAATDANNLYNTDMASYYGGIVRAGSAGSYTYATVAGLESDPVNFVSIFDAMRFANWLHNGQPTGPQNASTTEDGAYSLGSSGLSVGRNATWRWAVTSENEWYKAAYFQPASLGGDGDNYWRFPTSSNTVPTLGEANHTNSPPDRPTPVASYPANFLGTFDMGGNVWEWNERMPFPFDRVQRGGGFFQLVSTNDLASSTRQIRNPSTEQSWVGFRVSTLPGPSCPICPADYDMNGGVDGGDLAAFFTEFEAGAECADVDGNGGVDGGDLAEFFIAFEAGGC